MDDILSKPYSINDCRVMLARWLPAKPQVIEAQGDAAELAAVDADAVRALGKLGSGTSGLYERLVGLFEKSSQPLMARLDTAVRAHDLKQAADVCHTLKSSAANVGAMAFSTSVRELEQLCLHGDVAQATELHRRLAAAYEPLLTTLRSTRVAISA
jgi:HPt (histidine-containing phosphotransfer) domain-containing protein